MRLTPRIAHAVRRATELHAGQIRRDGDTPYVVHPLLVAALVADYTEDEDVIITGLLHDTVEDTAYTLSQAEQEFGPAVGKYLAELTEPSTHAGTTPDSWEVRKSRRLEQLKTASPQALIIFAADKIHNFRSLLEDYSIWGEEIWSRFHAEKDRQLWYVREMLQILKLRLNSKIVNDLDAVYEEALQTFSRSSS